MNNQLRMCRVCTMNEGDGKLVPIFENNSKVAFSIFKICQVKIIECNSHRIPALICLNCVKDLSQAMNFRKKCRKTDEFFKKFTKQTESLLFSNDGACESLETTSIKEEVSVDSGKIKNEPVEDLNLYLFENINTIVDNFTGSEENNLGEYFKKSLKETSPVESSDSESDYEEERDKKLTKRSTKIRDFDINPADGVAKCNLCFKTFTSVHSMKDHMRAIHQKLDESEMFRCPHCSRLFKMKYYLNRHIKTFHLKQTSKREKRSKPKVKHQDLDEIFKEKLQGLNCPYCNKFLTSKHSLNDHIRVRHEFINFSERFLCDICGKDFPLKYYLLRHIRATHLKTFSYKKKSEDHLPCSICGKILKSKGNLSTHEKTHRILTPDDYWYCDICGNKFKGRGEMTVHIKKRHLFKIRYPCEICPNKSWRTLFQLQRHVKVFHNNIREFKCEWCGKEFGEKNKLICHVRIHTGEQPFKCSFEGCSRAFTHQTDLRRHVWGHTGERPYKCQNQSCLKGFMKKSELTAHESRCHPVAKPLPMPFQYQMM